MNFKDFSRRLVKFKTFTRLYEPCNNPALDEKKNVCLNVSRGLNNWADHAYVPYSDLCMWSITFVTDLRVCIQLIITCVVRKYCKGPALYDTRMSFVTEWSSYCIHMIKSNSSAEGILSCVVFMPDQICMRHSPQITWLAIFKPKQGSFSVYRIPKIVSEWQFHWDWKPGWTHSGLTCTGTKCHFGIMYM